MKKFTVACVAFASVMAFAGAASAQEALGQEGQIAISSDLQLSFSSTSIKPPEGDSPDSITQIVIQPALDYFVIESLSIGGALGYHQTSQGDAKESGIDIGVRVGYAIPIADMVAFWPKVGIGYKTMSFSMDDGQGGTLDASGNKMALQVFAPFAISPADHFFIGIGPMLSMDLSSKVEDNDAAKLTTFGVMTQVGGYF
jgi:opacity protein-like surface antigen